MAKLSTNDARLLRRWLDDGAKAARFSVSNHLSGQMEVFPIARFSREGQGPGQGQQTPLVTRDLPFLGARGLPSFSGASIPPGEARTVSVAVLPHDGAWQIEFCYHVHDLDDSYLKVLKRTFAPTNPAGRGFLYTDWIKP